MWAKTRGDESCPKFLWDRCGRGSKARVGAKSCGEEELRGGRDFGKIGGRRGVKVGQKNMYINCIRMGKTYVEKAVLGEVYDLITGKMVVSVRGTPDRDFWEIETGSVRDSRVVMGKRYGFW